MTDPRKHSAASRRWWWWPEESRAEQVLVAGPPGDGRGGKSGAAERCPGLETRRRVTTGQLILLAAIIGLMIGIGPGSCLSCCELSSEHLDCPLTDPCCAKQFPQPAGSAMLG